jgi:HEAT repeat protein
MVSPAGRDALLAALVVVVAALFVVTLVFSAYAVSLRMRNRARDRRRARFAARWSEPLLVAVSDPEATAALRADVREEEQLAFVGFAVQYARRLRGEGRDTMRAVVRPYLDRVAQRAEAPSIEVRARAIQTLGMLGLPEHAPRVIAALDDPSPLVAMVAARALAQEESAEYAAAVLARLSRFQGWNRRFLASMLAAMGPQVSATFRGGLADPAVEPRTRAVLAEALILQGDLLAGDVAAQVLAAAVPRDLHVAALRLLHAVGRPDHAPIVREHVTSSDDVVRAQALRALGGVGTTSDVPMLLDAMGDASPWVALSAARAALEAGARSALLEIGRSERSTAALARQVLSEAGAAA